jgi:hypothetical protein
MAVGLLWAGLDHLGVTEAGLDCSTVEYHVVAVAVAVAAAEGFCSVEAQDNRLDQDSQLAVCHMGRTVRIRVVIHNHGEL